MKPVYFTQDQLKAVSNFMGKEAVRPYLQGVFCDPEGVMVATDGHRMGMVKASGVKSCGVGFILPSAAVQPAIKLKAKGLIVFKWDGKELVACLSPVGSPDLTHAETWQAITADEFVICRFNAKPIDGTFPEWRRVVPSNGSADEAIESQALGFNAAYVESFACPSSTVKSVYIIPVEKGENRFLITNKNPDFLGVIMSYFSTGAPPERERAFGLMSDILTTQKQVAA